MDSLTHTVLGACLGQLIGGKKFGKKAMIWSALANNIPDIDVISSLWLPPARGMLAHRGFTHSFLFLVLAAPLFAWLWTKIFKKSVISFRDWLLIFGSGMLMHIVLDAMTAYGTGWFEPFSHKRVTFNLIFVADPLFTLFFLVPAIVLWILPSDHFRRNLWSKISVACGTVYLFTCLWNKQAVDRSAAENFKQKNISPTSYFSTPTPFNNLLWYVLAGSDTGFVAGYRSVFDRSNEIQFTYFPKNESLLDSIGAIEEKAMMVRFSEGYYSLSQLSDTVIMSDLRFGQVGGWSNPKAPFVFQYYFGKHADNSLVFQRGRMKASSSEALKTMWQRIGRDL